MAHNPTATSPELEMQRSAAALAGRIVAVEADLRRRLIEGENTAAVRAELRNLRGQAAQLAAEISRAHDAQQQAEHARLHEEALALVGASARRMAAQLTALKPPAPPVPPAASAAK